MFTEALPPQSQSPSVTSVRCFHRFAWFSHWKPQCSPKRFRHNPNPLRDLRVLRAMLSPFRRVLALEAPMCTEELSPLIPIFPP
jgi:hypothetical protein